MAAFQRVDEVTSTRRNGSDVLDRLPPQNLEAERGAIGSILYDPDMCDEVSLVVRPEDFYSDANRKLFEHVLGMHNDGLRIDSTLLHERLRKSGDLDFIGGVAYLMEVAESVPHAANAVYYAQIVRDKATLRSLIHASTEILRDAFDESIEGRQMLSRAEEKIFGILERGGGGGEATPMADVLHAALDRIDARLERGAGIGDRVWAKRRWRRTSRTTSRAKAWPRSWLVWKCRAWSSRNACSARGGASTATNCVTASFRLAIGENWSRPSPR